MARVLGYGWSVAALAACLLAGQVALGQEGKSESYWLGIQATPVGETLKSHLKIEAGLVVGEVVDDAPAAKAGIRAHDILLKYNDVRLESVADLSGAIGRSSEMAAAIELIRGGEQQTITVTPAVRPAGEFALPLREFGDLGPLADEDRVLRWLRRFDGDKGAMRFHFPGPGIALPRGADGALPKGTSISIRREGDGPAKITVKRDGETWEVTEETLDKLPEDLRPSVKRMIEGRAGAAGEWLERFRDGKAFDFDFDADFGEMGDVREHLDKIREFYERLEKEDPFKDMRRQIDELNKKFKDLEEKGSSDRDSDREA